MLQACKFYQDKDFYLILMLSSMYILVLKAQCMTSVHLLRQGGSLSPVCALSQSGALGGYLTKGRCQIFLALKQRQATALTSHQSILWLSSTPPVERIDHQGAASAMSICPLVSSVCQSNWSFGCLFKVMSQDMYLAGFLLLFV